MVGSRPGGGVPPPFMVAYIPIVPRPGCTSSLSRVNYLRYTVDNVLLPLIHLIKLVHLLAIVVTPTRLATLTGFEPPPPPTLIGSFATIYYLCN